MNSLGNQMSDSDAEKIGLALRNNMSLNCLDLSYNCFGEIGGQHLGAGLVCNNYVCYSLF